MQIYSSPSAEATRLFARKLSERLQAGDVVWLQGNLGAGKTEFVKGMAEGFGVTDLVTSPTFALLNIYKGRIPLYHFDLYRLNRVEELYEIGFDEFVGGAGFVGIAVSLMGRNHPLGILLAALCGRLALALGWLG